MLDKDISVNLQHAIEDAVSSKNKLCIAAGNTKYFYGRTPIGDVLDVSEHSGVVNYEPTELVITVRAGTKLTELEALLAEQNQMLAFGPPNFGGSATIGGTVACNFSGPSRPFAGAVRDHVLGCRLINGKAQVLRFGGEVMKNVAGYDVSRLMCGAMGTLGVLLDVSLRVVPKPEETVTVVIEMSAEDALVRMHRIGLKAHPVSATCFDGERLYVRLSGAAGAVKAARQTVGGDALHDGDAFWLKVKEQQHAFFQSEYPLWRLSLPSNAPVFDIAGKTFYEWSGAQRWLSSDVSSAVIRGTAAEFGGHATQFKNHLNRNDVFHPLAPGIEKLHRNLKNAFDPEGVFNPGRMYSTF